MIKIIFKTGIFLVFILFIEACWVQKNWYSSYSIENQSGYELKLITYTTKIEKNKQIIEVGDTVSILVDSTFSEIQTHGEDAEFIGESSIFQQPDSLYLFFENMRYRVYYLCDSMCEERELDNILNIFAYDKNCPRNVGCDYTFTVTAKDFENANVVAE